MNFPEVTSDQGYSSDDEELEANRVHIRSNVRFQNNQNQLKNLGLNEYEVPYLL